MVEGEKGAGEERKRRINRRENGRGERERGVEKKLGEYRIEPAPAAHTLSNQNARGYLPIVQLLENDSFLNNKSHKPRVKWSESCAAEQGSCTVNPSPLICNVLR